MKVCIPLVSVSQSARRHALAVSMPRMLNSPPTFIMRMARYPLLTHVPWPTPPVPPTMALPLSTILSRPSTWHTVWVWSPPARPFAPLTRSSRPHPHPWTSPRLVPHLSSTLVLRSTSLWMWRKTPSLSVTRRTDPSSMRTLLIVSLTRLMRWSSTATMRC